MCVCRTGMQIWVEASKGCPVHPSLPIMMKALISARLTVGFFLQDRSQGSGWERTQGKRPPEGQQETEIKAPSDSQSVTLALPEPPSSLCVLCDWGRGGKRPDLGEWLDGDCVTWGMSPPLPVE